MNNIIQIIKLNLMKGMIGIEILTLRGAIVAA